MFMYTLEIGTTPTAFCAAPAIAGIRASVTRSVGAVSAYGVHTGR